MLIHWTNSQPFQKVYALLSLLLPTSMLLLRESICFFYIALLSLHLCDSFSLESPPSTPWRTHILVDSNDETISSCKELTPDDDRPDEDELEMFFPTARRYFQFPSSENDAADSDPIMIRQTSFGCGKLGYQVWSSAIALSLYLCNYQDLTKDQSVMELGAGCGLPSALCRDVLGAASVLATDFWMLPTSEWEKDRLIPENWHGVNLEFNICNDASKNANIQQLDWHKSDSIREALQIGKPKIVIGSDLVYYPTDVAPLWNTIEICLKEGDVDQVLLLSPLKPTMREALPEFRQLLEDKGKDGFTVEMDGLTLHQDEIGNSMEHFLRMSIALAQ